jgi:hypothetical protein
MALAPPAAQDEVPFPVARYQPAFDFLRPLLDISHVAKLAAALAALRLAAPHRLALPQRRDQLATQFAARQGVDRRVDRLV